MDILFYASAILPVLLIIQIHTAWANHINETETKLPANISSNHVLDKRSSHSNNCDALPLSSSGNIMESSICPWRQVIKTDRFRIPMRWYESECLCNRPITRFVWMLTSDVGEYEENMKFGDGTIMVLTLPWYPRRKWSQLDVYRFYIVNMT